MPANADSQRKRCFDPVVDAGTRVLILGSLPGEQSLARGEYYGNRQNRFWHLVSAVFGRDLVPLDYPARLAALQALGVGLWDVVAEAERPGSLDASIRAPAGNDLQGLVARLPALEVIAFNGGTAARLGAKVLSGVAERYKIVRLPSSSPAHTMAFAEKLQAWGKLKLG